MKKLLLFVGIGVLLFSGFKTIEGDETATKSVSDSEHIVLSAVWFQKSAEMQACYYQTYALATYKLKDHLSLYQGNKKPAVVLDIDETVLDNSPYQKFLIDKGELYSSATWKVWTSKATAMALPGSVDFTNIAKNLGVEVFYISNRKIDEMESTIKNLKDLAFANADSAFVLLQNDKSGDKTIRRNIVAENYEILLFIGDNLTDFDQLFADRDSTLGFNLVETNKALFGEKYIILPNPMYGEWERAIYKNEYTRSAQEKKTLLKNILSGY